MSPSGAPSGSHWVCTSPSASDDLGKSLGAYEHRSGTVQDEATASLHKAKTRLPTGTYLWRLRRGRCPQKYLTCICLLDPQSNHGVAPCGESIRGPGCRPFPGSQSQARARPPGLSCGHTWELLGGQLCPHDADDPSVVPVMGNSPRSGSGTGARGFKEPRGNASTDARPGSPGSRPLHASGWRGGVHRGGRKPRGGTENEDKVATNRGKRVQPRPRAEGRSPGPEGTSLHPLGKDKLPERRCEGPRASSRGTAHGP